MTVLRSTNGYPYAVFEYVAYFGVGVGFDGVGCA